MHILNAEEIEEIEKRAEAATPGPWKGDRFDGTVKYALLGSNGATVLVVNHKSGEYGFVDHEDATAKSGNDEPFVMHSRTDIPALTATVKHYMELLRLVAHEHLATCAGASEMELLDAIMIDEEECSCDLIKKIRAAVAEYDRKR